MKIDYFKMRFANLALRLLFVAEVWVWVRSAHSTYSKFYTKISDCVIIIIYELTGLTYILCILLHRHFVFACYYSCFSFNVCAVLLNAKLFAIALIRVIFELDRMFNWFFLICHSRQFGALSCFIFNKCINFLFVLSANLAMANL